MDCLHEKTKKKLVTKEVFDSEFKHKALVCENCGAVLRNNEYEKAYMNWLEGIYKNSRSKFQVQCSLPDSLSKCAESFLEDYPGISTTVFMKILVTVYLNIVDTSDKLSTQFNDLLDTEIYDSFSSDKESRRFSIQFKPRMMLDLVSVSEVLGEKPSIIAEECILKMMTAITSQDKKLKSFWENNIRGYLDIFLKAA